MTQASATQVVARPAPELEVLDFMSQFRGCFGIDSLGLPQTGIFDYGQAKLPFFALLLLPSRRLPLSYLSYWPSSACPQL